MLKATAKGKNGTVLIIGLSHANLDKLRADGTDGFIRIVGTEMDLLIDIMITAGETEAAMAHDLGYLIGPDTEDYISSKLKS